MNIEARCPLVMLSDVRFGLRMWARNPGFAAVAVLTLALGIGANTAVFSLMYALLLRSLPVPHPEELKFLVQKTRDGDRSFSFPAYRMLGDQCRSIAAIGTSFRPGPVPVSIAGGGVDLVQREYASAGYFTTLGLRPAAGRFFTWEEDRTLSAVVVISYRYWERAFNLSPDAIGAQLNRSGKPFTIIGVAPPGFSGLNPALETHVWFQITDGMWHNGVNDPLYGVNDHSAEWCKLLARLKPGVPERQAVAELNAVYSRYLEERARDLPQAERSQRLDRRITLAHGGAGDSPLGRKYQQPLTVLMVLVGLVLLLACAIIGNMLLARTAARSREMAIRLAVGAGRQHLVRQLLVESLLLAMMGGAVGLLFALWSAQALVAGYGITIDVTPDLRVLAFTAAMALGAGLLFGLVPALRAVGSDVAPVLKGTEPVLRIGRWHPGRLLVVVQVALSIVILTGTGLFARTLANLKKLDTGFVREQTILCDVITPMGWTASGTPAIWRLLDQVRQAPGVISASIGTVPSDTPLYHVEVEGVQAGSGTKPEAQLREVADGFFETLRTPLLQGRLIERKDCGGNKPSVAVVNASFARRFFGSDDPLGRHVSAEFSGLKEGPLEIVGVVADARYTNPKVKPLCEIFTPASGFAGARLLIRTSTDPRKVMATLPQFVEQSEPGLRVLAMDTLVDATDKALAQERLLAGLSGFFGLLALILAALGIFGVVSYTAAQRTHEIGIRMALGAPRVSVLWGVLRQTLVLLVAGLVLGIPVVFAGGRFVASLLYGLTPADPATLTLAVLALSGVALLAGYLPARRAARLDPLLALRCE